MTMFRRVGVALSLAALATALPAVAYACGCTPVLGRPVLTPEAEVAEQLAWSDLVFLGRVSGSDDRTLTFDIEAYWKGDGAPTVLLNGPLVHADGSMTISDCDYSFASNTVYVVFAHRTARGLSASSCSKTSRLEDAAALLTRLDRVAARRVVRRPGQRAYEAKQKRLNTQLSRPGPNRRR